MSTCDSAKDIVVCDRATLFNLLIGLDGYTICSGIISEKLNGPNILAIPLDVDEKIEIGYILHNKVAAGKYCRQYIEALKKNTQSV